MQRAVVMRRFGSPAKEALELVTDHPKPKRGKGEVLIQVHGTSLNPIDCKTRRGEMPKFLVSLPKVLGGDVSGIVVESDSDAFPVGARVMALTEGFQMWVPWGCYCEYVSVPEGHLVMVPSDVDLVEAAGVPLVSVTASMALNAICPSGSSDAQHDDDNTSSSDQHKKKKILIHGGSGGVGSMCIQLAKQRGYEVYTTSSHEEFCADLGADHVINYKTSRFWEMYGKGEFDAVIDPIGGEVETHSLQMLDRHGVYVCIMHGHPLGTFARLFLHKLQHALGFGPAYHVIMVSPNQGILQEVALLLEDKKVRPVTSKVVPLSGVMDAHDEMDRGLNTKGKIVFTVREQQQQEQ
ncbi:hypothetical protein M9434_006747 [Picochlorum sp. BPE23]|nr:hypothetical protein M9434_006747 [Picochlorum sp. BPE23]